MTDEVQRSLGRIEGKLDTALDMQAEHAKRIEKVERYTNQIAGALALVTVLIPVALVLANNLH
jgi:hypothetical protein